MAHVSIVVMSITAITAITALSLSLMTCDRISHHEYGNQRFQADDRRDDTIISMRPAARAIGYEGDISGQGIVGSGEIIPHGHPGYKEPTGQIFSPIGVSLWCRVGDITVWYRMPVSGDKTGRRSLSLYVEDIDMEMKFYTYTGYSFRLNADNHTISYKRSRDDASHQRVIIFDGEKIVD